MKKLFSRTLAAILMATGVLVNPMQATTPHFDVNDVSWLFPFPSKSEHLEALISIESLKAENGQHLWPMAAFESVLAIADGDDSSVEGVGRIKLPEAVRQMSAWKIAGVRFDPSAPGSAKEIIHEFGSDPQIRLILQPVTGIPPKTHDITIHLIYSFSNIQDGPLAANTFAKAVPDEAAFLEIVKDLDAVRSLTAELGATTAGVDLGVHPGLLSSTASAKVRKGMETMLQKHLIKGKLRAMAIMGLPNEPEPWIFVAIIRTPDGKFVAAPGFNMPSRQQTAQALSFRPAGPKGVLPSPINNNLSLIRNQVIVPHELRRGVSTALLFKDVDPASKVEFAKSEGSANPIFEEIPTNADIVDIVANPNHSHFFNTDCVSCHTETTRAELLKFKPGKFAFKKTIELSHLSKAAIPRSNWNVRNFGWGPPREPIATVSRRAFNESAESAEFINKNYLPRLVPAENIESEPANQ